MYQMADVIAIIGELKRDKTRVILKTDKGVSLVVMDKDQYINKAELLNQPIYKTISSDPTTKYKNKLISLLKTIKTEGGMSEALYKRLYPTGAGSPILWASQGPQRRDSIEAHSL